MLFRKKHKNKFDIPLSERIWFSIKNMSFIKHILIFYLLITFIGSGILMLPFAHTHSVNYIDALFTSASAFSDTGLVTKDTYTTWTMFGQAIIATLILMGGIGWFALKVFIFNIIFNRPISLITRTALAGERGNVRMGETREIIKISIITVFTIMTIAGIALSIHFYYTKHFIDLNHVEMGVNPHGDWNLSIRYGIFHSISAMNNAGFDIIGAHSIAPYFNDYFVQIVFIILFVIGGIGYPVIFDIYKYLKHKKTGTPFKFSLFTKISTITYFIIAIIGISSTFIIEVNAKDVKKTAGAISEHANETFWGATKLQFDPPKGHTGAWKEGIPLTTGNKIMAIIFNTLSTRNAGFSTINFHEFTSSTLMVHSIMMFIGSAPSSTAGGIRTTTFAIVIMAFWSKIRGKTSVRVFKRRISHKTVWDAYVVTTISIAILVVGSLIATSSFQGQGGDIPFGGNYVPGQGEPRYDFADIFFETSSAFGTTGLSTGLTSQLNTVSKLTLILIMFIGQLGVSSSILSFGTRKQNSRHYKYIEEDITIG